MGFVLGASLFSQQDQKRTDVTERGQAQQHHSNQTRTLPSAQQAKARVVTETQNPAVPKYDPACNDPKDREDADLCEQRRMAKSAEEAVGIAWVQAWIAGAGIGLVALSVAFAGWAAYAASQAATATSAQVRLSQQAMLNTQRAFVYVQGFYGIAHTDESGKVVTWAMMPIWENNGATGTRRLYNHVSCRAFPSEPPANFDFPDLWEENATPGAVALMLGPKSTLRGRRIHIPVEDLIAVAAGTRQIYMWGWAEYDDVFEGTDRHRTEFCVQVNVIGDPTLPKFEHFTPSSAPWHNGADEECGQRYRDAQRRRPRRDATEAAGASAA